MAKSSKAGAAFMLKRFENAAPNKRQASSSEPGFVQYIDFSKANPPERSFLAREAWCEMDKGIVQVCFGQKKRTSRELRSIVVINMTSYAVTNWLESIDSMQSPSIDEILETINFPAEEVKAIDGEPAQAIELTANLAHCAVSGLEAAINFYRLSPFAVFQTKLNPKANAELDPQVHIDLRTPLFAGLLKALRELANNFPDEVMPKKG